MAPVVCSPSKEAWLLTEDKFNPNHAFHYESIFTLANGYAGVRGSLEMNTELGDAGFYVAGVFDQVHEFTHEIVNLPCWLGVGANMDGFNFDLRRGKILEYRRTLDMKQGLLFTHIVYRDPGMHTTRWESVRLMHMKHKHLAIEWGTIKPLDYSGTVQMTGSIDAWLGRREVVLAGNVYGDSSIFGAAAGLVRSEALIRLHISGDAPPGMLAFGSREPDMFHQGQGTELIGFLARVVERCIRNWLDLPA